MRQPMESREVRLRKRPEGTPSPDDFELAFVPVPPPGSGEVQVRNTWMSVDPYMRGRMKDRKSYVPPFKIGEALDGGAVGQVTASGDPGFSPGDLVQSGMGWREAFTVPAAKLQKLPAAKLPPECFLGVAGMPGLTAHIGVHKVAKVGAGDVVFVSAASGAVGSVAAQLAKNEGATVIGSAGGPEKCAFLREIGLDGVIDYRAEPDLAAALAACAPDGIDVYYDNVGGPHLEAALASAKPHARFALCGMISGYNADDAKGPPNIALAVGKLLRLEGFIVSDHFDMMPGFVREMTGLIEAGRIKWKQTVVEGIEQAPDAFIKLFSGENFGKMLVRL